MMKNIEQQIFIMSYENSKKYSNKIRKIIDLIKNNNEVIEIKFYINNEILIAKRINVEDRHFGISIIFSNDSNNKENEI